MRYYAIFFHVVKTCGSTSTAEAAYIYYKTSSMLTFTLLQKLSSGYTGLIAYGTSVSINSNRAIVGAPQYKGAPFYGFFQNSQYQPYIENLLFFFEFDAGNASGVTYVYSLTSASLWTQLGIVYPANGTKAHYGYRSSLSSFNEYAIVGGYTYGIFITIVLLHPLLVLLGDLQRHTEELSPTIWRSI